MPLRAQVYQASSLSCAVFQQRVDGTVRTELNGKLRLERTGRDGRLFLSAAPDSAGIRVQLWWDSLSIWRDAAGVRDAPETDGLLGGRYVGILGAQGGWTSRQVPFIPDGVAAITDLTGVPEDLLPLLPPDSLKIGGRWADTAGTVVVRLADSLARGERWRRFSISRRSDHEEERGIGGPKPARISDTETETSRLTWHPTLGPWRWDRSIVAETRVVADPKRAFRSRLEQRIILQRERVDSSMCRGQ